MPLYTFIDHKTGDKEQAWMSYDEMKEYLSKHPNLEIDFAGSSPGLHSGIGLGVRKPDEGFKDLLGEMKKTHNKRGGNVNDFR